MNTPARLSASLAFAFLLAACSSDGMPASVRTVSVAHGTRHTPQVLAPEDSRYFSSVAQSRGTRIANRLRTSIVNELADSERYQYRSSGAADAEIVVNRLRHGLVEVSDGLYAVSVSGDITIHRAGWRYGRTRHADEGGGTRSRDFSGTSGIIRPLAEFENAANYDEAARAAVDKIAVEVVAGL